MIPLGQWLASQPRLAAEPPPMLRDFAVPDALPDIALLDGGASEEALAAAKAEGAAEACAAAQAELAAELAKHEAALEALRSDAETARTEAVALARETWCAEQAEVMESKLAAAFATLEQDISKVLAQCLVPFLEEKARVLAITEFSTALKTLAGQDGLVRLEAPADLLAALKARPGGVPPGVDVQVSEQADLFAVAGGALIESALSQWLAAIREAAA